MTVEALMLRTSILQRSLLSVLEYLSHLLRGSLCCRSDSHRPGL